jgi:3-phenylpropionate/cinnamic acid dioxygenase small subunit
MSETAASPEPLTFADYHAICVIQDRYTGLLDSGDHEAWLALFTDDATLTIGERAWSGMAGLEEYLDGRHPHVGKHVTAAPVVTAADASRCHAEANFLAVKRTEAGLIINGTGRYHDEYARGGGGWRLQSRRVVIGAKP